MYNALIKDKEIKMLPDPIISFGKIEVYMYGIMIAVGVLAAFAVLFLYGKKLSIDPKLIDFTFYNGIASIFVGFGSAAVFQGLYEYIENPEAGFSLNNGITFIGGLIGGVICFLLVYFILKNKLDIRLTEVLSLVPCCITVAHGLGRVGCFFAGCCYGRETNSFLGVKFPGLPNPVHATQLYEAAFLFILFAVMTVLLLKYGFKHNMSVYLIAYGIFRFAIEYLRADDRGQLVAGISPSQFWSIGMVIFGVALWICLNMFYKKQNIKTQNSCIDINENNSSELNK